MHYDVEAAPIYRYDDKAGQPIVRPHRNHDLHMEQEPTQMESQQKQQIQSRAIPASRSLCNKYKNVFAPGILGRLPDTYLVPVSYIWV